MKCSYPEFVVSSNNAFMFHKNTASTDDIVNYDVFHTGMSLVAQVRFFNIDDVVACLIVDLDGSTLKDLTDSNITRDHDGKVIHIWKCGFNIIGDEVRKKLKLKAA